jgi:Rieske Fe-S protein
VIAGGLVITRSGSTVRAFSSTCPHQGCQVNKVSDGKIDCPCHGSVFDARTGAVLAGPAPSGLPPRPVTVRNGEVFSG